MIAEEKRVTIPFIKSILKPVVDLIHTKASKTDILQSDWNQTDETQKDFIKNKPEGLAYTSDVSDAIANIPQTDWNQNDTTAADYVKGRTHYITYPISTIYDYANRSFVSNDTAYLWASFPNVALAIGKEYTINWNGTTYVSTCLADEDGIPYIGNMEILSGIYTAGDPFLIYKSIICTMDIGSEEEGATLVNHAVTVTGPVVTYIKLDDRYISDNIARADDVPANCTVPNMTLVTSNDGETEWQERTHYAEYTKITWDDVTEGKVSCAQYYKVSDLTPTLEELQNANYKIQCYKYGDIQAPRAMPYAKENANGLIYFGMSSMLKLVCVVPTAGLAYSSSLSFPEAGIYFNMQWKASSSDSYPVSMFWENGYHQLDEKYIPDTIARVTDIPAPVEIDNTLSVEGAAADAKAVGDALAETGVWYVHATANDDGPFTLDKTYDEIIAAYDAGRKVQCEMRFAADAGAGAYIFDLITFGPYVPDVNDGDTVYNGALFVLWMQNRMMRMLVTTDNQVMMFQTNRFQTEGELQIRYGNELMYAGHMGVDVDIDLNIPINAPKDYIALRDHTNGYTYLVGMVNGTLVSTLEISELEIASYPNTMVYTAGDELDLTGLVVNAVRYDGSKSENIQVTHNAPSPLSTDVMSVTLSYNEFGKTYTVELPITVAAFAEEAILVDFDYTDNGDGTYTLTGWKGTYQGVESTEMIIPNYSSIIL